MSAATLNTSTATLNDGNKIPYVGFGTWQVNDETDGYDALIYALKHGYRHIDTAFAYKNEAVVGKAVRDSGIPREEIFVVSKLWGKDHRDPAAALDKSLKLLGLDYVDLYLMHWPVPFKNIEDKDEIDEDWNHVKTWELMQKLPKSKVKSIGVSNYDTALLEELSKAPTTTVVPVINQVELHPYLAQDKLRDYCNEHKIVLEAYCPLGKGTKLLEEPIVVELAEKYKVSPGQIALSWGIARGYVVIPKSSTPSRIEANLHTVKLSKEDEEKLTSLSKTNPQRRVRPGWKTKILFNDDDF
ncbi:trifunctional aldehyde reductase/carbonyl reductase (NADPH)/glucose 1-dehydrogenase (NADP(+)) YPR1 [Sugiyamaella lignohabitans]|uniref:Trifunctional aldehyde reductase/carbonyl reductase (NADPH)/glucose 1-dehydrogenase (NADP(+)) YPR1 n=1 Tax=Sugiyamaella lignohabitans TaxID=796027 RepID=A0A167C054_9ASCO|nr:trifunctional aldehyde reductase/carbonyl reductase (NADPH)/glucose 1-dehydrogenase (NADP(+)) YPR1 [Sugiyamaella lignohabitans]ANB11046.1 trifunctional aldehyde reductase/carbonyl reductase (NADPH)/glucose 1-dehydrogenase (NADP(+)) YPR1 [Sugiyamaella lignohabitans]